MHVKRKIGIMGGTFDPVHFGHLLIAQSAAEEFQLDEVLFLPTGQSPHKATEAVTAPSIRLQMVKLAIADNAHFSVSDIEVKNDTVNYTYQTLAKLSSEYPDSEFYFIMGGDSVKDFHHWREPASICKQAVLLAAVRDEMIGDEMHAAIEKIKSKYDAKMYLLHSPNFSVSSRDIRKRVEEGNSIRYLLPQKVADFIKVNQLYRKG